MQQVGDRPNVCNVTYVRTFPCISDRSGDGSPMDRCDACMGRTTYVGVRTTRRQPARQAVALPGRCHTDHGPSPTLLVHDIIISSLSSGAGNGSARQHRQRPGICVSRPQCTYTRAHTRRRVGCGDTHARAHMPGPAAPGPVLPTAATGTYQRTNEAHKNCWEEWPSCSPAPPAAYLPPSRPLPTQPLVDLPFVRYICGCKP
jgi:hypothetical protein